MSDGNFNKQLLPKTELSSGLRAGKAQMRMKAIKAFEEVMNSHLNHLSVDEKDEMKRQFTALLG